MRLSVECAFPYLGKRGATSRKGALWVSASRKSALCASRLTERRILEVSPSRKSALCASRLTERRILGGRRDGKAHSACAPHQETHSACEQSRRMRLSVRTQSQNAPFRRMRLSSPGQTRRRLTKNRILRPPSHEKPHSGPSGLIHHRVVIGDAGTPDSSS